jgi:hypothetical protein
LHFEGLEREGIVERREVRQAVEKPAHEYRLTNEGSRGYRGLTFRCKTSRLVVVRVQKFQSGLRLRRRHSEPNSACELQMRMYASNTIAE